MSYGYPTTGSEHLVVGSIGFGTSNLLSKRTKKLQGDELLVRIAIQ